MRWLNHSLICLVKEKKKTNKQNRFIIGLKGENGSQLGEE